MLFPSGEPAEAHPAAHGNLLELSELFFCDRVLDWIKVQKRPWAAQREAGLEFREDCLELRPDGREVPDWTRPIAKSVALATDCSFSTDGTSNEVVLVHLNVDKLTAKYFHPLPNPWVSCPRRELAFNEVLRSAPAVIHSD